ncbi:MAG TPA: sensor histidine kinase [Flavitalea sp.]|nr:sensor histidine kinase [Flavitalea sp.]
MRISLFILLLVFAGNSYAHNDSKDTTAFTKQIKAWLRQCWDYRFHDPDSARYFGYKALTAAREKGDRRYEAEALHNIGIVFEAQGNYYKALELALEALEIRKALNDGPGIANTCNNIGIIYDQMGDFTRALDFYNEAYTRYKAAQDREKLAMVSVNLGILFKSQGAYDKVIGHYQEAYQVYRELGRADEIAFCEANLGSVYYYTKQYDSCLYYSLLAEKALTARNNLQYLPVAQANAGMAFFETGRRKEAEIYLQRSLKGHREYENKKEIAFVLIQLAKIFAAEGAYDKAIGALTETKRIAEKIHAPQQAMDASKLLSEYYAARNDFRNAWEEHANYAMIKDSLFEEEKMKTIAAYQTRYETEKKERQIEMLHQESAIQKLKLKQHNVALGALIALIFAGGGFVYFILNQRKLKAEARLEAERRRRQQEASRAVLLAEERERRRLASDLHDGVGQMLSAALINLNHAYERQEQDTGARELTARALSLLNDGYDEMRSLSHRVMPKALIKEGLPLAVKELLSKINGAGLQASLDAAGFNERLPEQTETILYRVIQEAVNNVIKHAAATTLSVQLVKDEEGVAINIEDDGKGFDPAQLKQSAGIGIKNILSRLSLLKGTVDIDAAPGRGTLVAIFIPAGHYA